ncbi:hypothetical protein ONZ43_g6742 [Nemania bipapillata]|uniref:Uncharacterized protein n=1 Tax=Nemania bipapillata TaxID=110536 RepID=A0ACC2HXH1_9PEZI|nr:hypothetical protein ONZ43_g6742 [Nemania bipapillata]
MATEQKQQQPAVTVLGRPRDQQQPSPTLGESSSTVLRGLVEVRDYEFFAQRDFNEYKDASRAYFAEKNGNPSSWLGDATPPASAHPSLDEPRPVPGELSYQSSEEEPRNRKILGLHRLWFWTLLAILGVVIVVAVGVGVGVGTTRPSSGSKNASGVGPASETSSITTAGTQTTAGVSCPGVNGTVYTVPGSTKQFLQLCGVDYGKEDGAVDLRNVSTNTADDCMNNCAGTAGCTGCGWGFIDGDHGPPYRCWLKSYITNKSHTADTDWQFAVLLTGAGY